MRSHNVSLRNANRQSSSRTKRQSLFGRKTSKHFAKRRALRIESLENRSLLAIDLQLTDLGAGNEPNITVNPYDPANIIAAQFNQLNISTDFGKTFSTSITAQLPTTVDTDYGF